MLMLVGELTAARRLLNRPSNNRYKRTGSWYDNAISNDNWFIETDLII
jgi:hypothetical protein